MSYCVNCGVELSNAEPACPLCFTEVINPRHTYKAPERPNYPNVPVSGYKRGFRELLAPLALLMLIPVVTSVIADVLTGGTVTWSGYIVVSIALCGLYVFPPLAFKKPRLLLCLTLDWLGAGVFIYFIAKLSGGQWFFDVGLPIVSVAGALTLGLAAVCTRTGLNLPAKAALGFFAAALQLVCTQLLINAHSGSGSALTWSLYAFAPLVILGLACLLISRNRRLKESVRRTLHY